MRRIRLLILLAVLATLVTGCIVNAKAAEKESLEALEAFLAAHEHGEVLLDNYNGQGREEVVEEEYAEWFTKDYQAKVNEVIRSGKRTWRTIFFMQESGSKLVAYNKYGVLYTKVDRKDGTIRYRLHPQKVNPLHENLDFVDIEMSKEDGKWKINDAEIVEAIYADYFF
ncbi:MULTISPECIES: hypothetical protein [Shouchella]|uniref:Uncharacterized protein n=2 Tax=Shouchella clausii TaxID=79880 RepID=A0A268NYP0_SHOCL|nr:MULTISPECIES: hypothetical protein [Shouchella]SPU21303.1 Uncharacterised protein [Niallia circulans]KKI86904.1 hypothetical protein WZ76_08235 [Shouchella clausii]MBU3230407.1 hypothetical protein [Shouchella clausii]MBU3262394.1 hypothetical protein [Shouchella clausii]MBU3507291.1 hypothetical protein [Shouchella clausii]